MRVPGDDHRNWKTTGTTLDVENFRLSHAFNKRAWWVAGWRGSKQWVKRTRKNQRGHFPTERLTCWGHLQSYHYHCREFCGLSKCPKTTCFFDVYLVVPPVKVYIEIYWNAFWRLFDAMPYWWQIYTNMIKYACSALNRAVQYCTVYSKVWHRCKNFHNIDFCDHLKDLESKTVKVCKSYLTDQWPFFALFGGASRHLNVPRVTGCSAPVQDAKKAMSLQTNQIRMKFA